MNLIKTHRRAWSGWRSFYTSSQTALTYSGHEINDGTRCSIRGRFAVTKHSFICPGDELRLHERRGKSIRAAALAFITMNAYQSQNILAFFNKKITRTHPRIPGLSLAQLAELVDVVVEEGARLFVTAVGIPPVWVVEKLHSHGILVMNMVGSPKHVPKALAVGVDAVCAQGTEAGGHTGDVSTMTLVPQCVDMCAGHTSPLHGGPVVVVGAGGIFDGKGVACSLRYYINTPRAESNDLVTLGWLLR